MGPEFENDEDIEGYLRWCNRTAEIFEGKAPMTSAPDESTGTLEGPLLCQFNCPKCKNHHGNTMQYWRPTAGGNEMSKHACWKCHHVWWHEHRDLIPN